MLQTLSTMSTLPWVFIGDYNDLLSQSEKRGLRSHPTWMIMGFRSAVENSGLIDIGVRHVKFFLDHHVRIQNIIIKRI